MVKLPYKTFIMMKVIVLKRDGIGIEGIGGYDVGPGFDIFTMNAGYSFRLGQRQQIVVSGCVSPAFGIGFVDKIRWKGHSGI